MNKTQASEKRKHKASRYNTKDYHSDVVKKRQKTTTPSASNQVVTSPSSQPSITSFLIEASGSHEQSIELKNEDYFKVPSYKKGFNLLSLRRSFPSTKTNVNIVGLIKKNVLNNNVVKWSVQSKLCSLRASRSNTTRNQNENNIPSITTESLSTNIISRNYHRLYVEDFILLSVGDRIKVLIPDKALRNKTKSKYAFDTKFISCALEVDAPITQIGAINNRFHVLSCEVMSSPNRTQSLSGIDRSTFQNGFKGNQNFGSLVRVEDSDYIPLLKWRDILNGRRDGLQVSKNIDLMAHNEITIKHTIYILQTN